MLGIITSQKSMKTAIITGASGGIGKELVKLFLTNNWKVLAVSRNTKALEDIKHKELIVLEADINKKEDREKIEKLADTLSPIEVLINNAGKLLNKPFSGIDEKELQEVYSANVFAPFHLIQRLLPQLIKGDRGHVVNIGSMGGFQGSVKFAGLTAYSSSKFALAGLTELLAEEFKDENISFNCLAIGAAQTEMLAKAFPGYLAPLTAKEMASFIFDFATKNAKFINGKVIPVSVTTP